MVCLETWHWFNDPEWCFNILKGKEHSEFLFFILTQSTLYPTMTLCEGNKKRQRCNSAMLPSSHCIINPRRFWFFLHTSHPGNPRLPGVK
jgi:hypothetical protein